MIRPAPLVFDREMLLLKRRLGGTITEQRIGSRSFPVLRLADGVAATTVPVDPSSKQMLALRQIDVHVLRSQGDISEFARKYKNFRGASGQKEA